jgi:HK97 gp10 family phage protein
MANELAGVRELTTQLNKLQGKTQVKALRSALFKATTPVVRQMKGKIPTADRAARTYKGRLVGPGFASRSIKRITGRKFLALGKLSIAIGVKREAWYAINMLDQGPHTITERRMSVGPRARQTVQVKPYTLRRQPWLENTFRANRSQMLSAITQNLRTQIERIARSG